MTAHGCKYSPDSFCYVCCEFFAKRAKKHCLSNCICAAEAYLHYFGMPVGDQDKRWATHVICDYCRRTLKGWLRGEKRAMRFAISRIWREPSNHYTDCYSWIQQNEEREKMHLQLSILTFHHLLPLFFITPPTCLCHSHPQEINLILQRQVLRIPKMRKVHHHHHHLLFFVDVELGIKGLLITLIKKISMILFERWN